MTATKTTTKKMTDGERALVRDYIRQRRAEARAKKRAAELKERVMKIVAKAGGAIASGRSVLRLADGGEWVYSPAVATLAAELGALRKTERENGKAQKGTGEKLVFEDKPAK